MSKSFPFIFPHINKKQQRKEIPYIYCYNIRIVRSSDNEVKEYSQSIKAFIEENKHNLVSWNDQSKANRIYKRIAENDNNTDRSVYWDVKYVSVQEKKELDSILQITRYPKPVDQWGYVYEGCYNDDKLFLGNRDDMVSHYCKVFPNTNYCTKFKTKTQAQRLDEWAERVLDNPESLDAYAEKWLKSISL
jgi:hypothetical protein